MSKPVNFIARKLTSLLFYRKYWIAGTMMTNEIYFKLREKKTGKFWNANYSRSSFTSLTGKKFKSEHALNSKISDIISHQAKYQSDNSQLAIDIINNEDDWEIVKFETFVSELSTNTISSSKENILIRNFLQSRYGTFYSYFWDEASRRGYAHEIKHIFSCLPPNTPRYNCRVFTKEGRKMLKDIGFNARSFKEIFGVFGLTSDDQAFSAQLTLPGTTYINITKIRNEINKV